MIRGQKVLLDANLAELDGVITTKRLNEPVKRNLERFPADFLLPLMAEDKAQVVAYCDHLARKLTALKNQGRHPVPSRVRGHPGTHDPTRTPVEAAYRICAVRKEDMILRRFAVRLPEQAQWP